jgi:hypothetical protein
LSYLVRKQGFPTADLSALLGSVKPSTVMLGWEAWNVSPTLDMEKLRKSKEKYPMIILFPFCSLLFP